MKASKNAHDWHCEAHDTYGWVGEECRKCPVAPSETTAIREQVEKLEALVVMRCDLEVPPQFSQGLQSHEVLEPVTAEHCQWFVAKIEKLTKERDWCGSRNWMLRSELAELDTKLAALAEQNERQSKALNTLLDISQVSHVSANTLESVCRSALSLPDLATPVLNKYRAEGMRMAAEILIDPMDRAAAQKICAQADELEKQNG